MNRFVRLSVALAWTALSIVVPPVQAGEWDALLDRLEKGCSALGQPPPKSMTAVQILKELDGDGRPKSITTVTKAVVFRDSTRVDSILKAVETKSGKTRDVTKEWVEKDAKEKADRERKSDANKKSVFGKSKQRSDRSKKSVFGRSRKRINRNNKG